MSYNSHLWNMDGPYIIGRWWVNTVQSAKRTADEIGPTWRWIALTVLAGVVSGSVWFGSWTASSIGALREAQAAQAKDYDVLRQGIELNSKISTLSVDTLEKSLAEHKAEMREMNRLLQELNVKLARQQSRR